MENEREGDQGREVEEKQYMARASIKIIYDNVFMYRMRQYSKVT